MAGSNTCWIFVLGFSIGRPTSTALLILCICLGNGDKRLIVSDLLPLPVLLDPPGRRSDAVGNAETDDDFRQEEGAEEAPEAHGIDGGRRPSQQKKGRSMDH